MNVEIGAEAALFPGKEYIIGIAVAVYNHTVHFQTLTYGLLSGCGVRFICTNSKTMSSHDCTKCGKGTFTHPHTLHTSTHIQRVIIVTKKKDNCKSSIWCGLQLLEHYDATYLPLVFIAELYLFPILLAKQYIK
jgi:hypothetical protein